jgi:hypothetical protein
MNRQFNLRKNLFVPISGIMLLISSLPAFATTSLAVIGDAGQTINSGGVDQRYFHAPSYYIEVSGPQVSPLVGNTEGVWSNTSIFSVDNKALSSARANYGSLGVRSMSWANGGMYDDLIPEMAAKNIWEYRANSSAVASFTDGWTVDAGSLNGTIGTLSVTVELEGTRQAAYDYHSANLSLGVTNYSRGSHSKQDLYAGLYTFNVPFMFGSVNNIKFELGAFTSAAGHVDSFYYRHYRQGGIQDVDFLNTATVTGLALYSSDNAIVSNYVFTSESGHDYFRVSQPVPVPSAALLFGSCLFGFLGFRRRRFH